jgi:hypothetical protein
LSSGAENERLLGTWNIVFHVVLARPGVYTRNLIFQALQMSRAASSSLPYNVSVRPRCLSEPFGQQLMNGEGEVVKHPVVRGVIAVLAVVVVLVGLKLFGLAPDDVFTPRADAHVNTPLGPFSVGSERAKWFPPLLLAHLLSVPPMWRLCSRLGYSGWFSLAMLVPLANIFLLYFLAFAEWPLGQRPAVTPIDTQNGAAGVVAGPRKLEDARASGVLESSPGVIQDSRS